jgi:excisionase family DNA binding protein
MKLITVSEIARRLQVSPGTVRRWLAAGQGPAHVKTPRGHHRFLDGLAVEQWIETLRATGTEVLRDKV